MIIADLNPAERLHLAVALRDRARALRRNGQQLPPRLAVLADALMMRPDPASSGQGYGLAGPAGDDRRAAHPSAALLNAGEAAARLGVSDRTLRRAAAAGDVVSVLENGRRRYRPGDLEAYVAGLPPGKRAR